MRDIVVAEGFYEGFMSCGMSDLEMFMVKSAVTGALYIDVYPYSCISFTNIEKKARTDVL